jgi:phospholipid/cholesterol/gamma-HCH transport system permease protein
MSDDAVSTPDGSPGLLRLILARVGASIIDHWRSLTVVSAVGAAVLWKSLQPATWKRTVRGQFMRQCWEQGPRTLPAVLVAGVLAGPGLVPQALYWLGLVNERDLAAELVVLVLIREIAPLLVAIIMLGRNGSVMVMELARMRINGQIHALDAQGVDPVLYLLLPRVLASALCLLCLTILFLLTALTTGYMTTELLGMTELSSADFRDDLLSAMTANDYFVVPFKAVAIGYTIGLISCVAPLYRGQGRVSPSELLSFGFTRSALSALLISVALSLLF